jgi:hypothetical protein
MSIHCGLAVINLHCFSPNQNFSAGKRIRIHLGAEDSYRVKTRTTYLMSQKKLPLESIYCW